MWRGKRLERLEKEVAEARAERAALQRRVDLFEKIAKAAGAALDETGLEETGLAETGLDSARSDEAGPCGTVPIMPVPQALLAAAQDPRRTASPVRLAVGGNDVIAVIGNEGGDPLEWWAAIQRLASGLRSAS